MEKTRDLGSRFGSSAVELPSLEQSKVQSDINSANQVKNFQGSGNITLDMPNIDRLDSTGSCVRSSDILNASDLAEAPEDSPKEIESKTSVVLPEKRKSDHSLSLPPDITPIDEEVISKNRLSLEGIREIPRFKDYEPGEPNKVCIKDNLRSFQFVRSNQSVLKWNARVLRAGSGFALLVDQSHSVFPLRLAKAREIGKKIVAEKEYARTLDLSLNLPEPVLFEFQNGQLEGDLSLPILSLFVSWKFKNTCKCRRLFHELAN